jgi:hypothetical protein
MHDDDETFFDSNGQEFYKDTNNPVWPHRLRELPKASEPNQALAEDNYVSYLLGRLDELEKQTRPSGGSTTSKRKDLAAFDALEISGELVRHVAGWAIDHQMGLASEGLQFVPLQPSGTKQHPEYLQKKSSVDSHSHEKTGSKTGAVTDPFFVRKCLVNLLRANPGGWPRWLCHHVIEAIESLEFGEVWPVFTPIKEGRKRDLTVLKLQLRAVAIVAFRSRAYGITKGKAQEEVANTLDVDKETIKTWEYRLRNELGRLQVDRTISFAENHASWICDANKKKRLGQQVGRDLSAHEPGYDENALIELREQIKTALAR